MTLHSLVRVAPRGLLALSTAEKTPMTTPLAPRATQAALQGLPRRERQTLLGVALESQTKSTSVAGPRGGSASSA